MKKVSYIFIFFNFLSCVEPFDFVLDQSERILVVEGGVFELEKSWLSLSFTSNIGNSANPEIIKDAQILVTENNDLEILYNYDFTAKKYFPTDLNFRGKIGKTYSLKILLKNGDTYQAKAQKLQPAESLNEIVDRFSENTSMFIITGELPKKSETSSVYLFNFLHYQKAQICATCREEQGYEREAEDCGSLLKGCIDISGQDPRRSLYGFGCNNNTNCWNYKKIREGIIFSDSILAENSLRSINLFEVPLSTYRKYYIEIHQNRISSEAYEYYQLVKDAGESTGTLFDPTPPLIVGNIYRGEDTDDVALGFFLVAGQQKYGHYVDRSKAQGVALIAADKEKEISISFRIPTPRYTCELPPVSRCIPNNSFITDITPVGW